MKVKKTQYAELTLKEEIVHLVYLKNDLVDVEDAKIIVQDRLDFCDGMAYPHLFDITSVNKFSKEARDYFADKGNDNVTASAIIINSPVARIIANFFISVNKPKSPTKMFTKKDEALNWLEQFKEPSLL